MYSREGGKTSQPASTRRDMIKNLVEKGEKPTSFAETFRTRGENKASSSRRDALGKVEPSTGMKTFLRPELLFTVFERKVPTCSWGSY